MSMNTARLEPPFPNSVAKGVSDGSLSRPQTILQSLTRLVSRAALAFSMMCGLFWAQNVVAQDIGFTMHPDNPVLLVGPAGAWDSAFVDPAAVILHDGQFHSFYAGVPSWPHDLAVGHASSSDGVTWKRSGPNPVLTGDGTSFATKSINPNSVIVTEDGQWVLFFTIASHGSFKGSIGRAVAPHPTGPWVVDANPILLPGSKGRWDHRGIGNASVVKSEDGFTLYYSGEGEVKGEPYSTIETMIGMATSSDGVTWVKYDNPATTDELFHDSDPVMRGSNTPANWANDYVTDPNVQRTSDGLAMVFRAGNGKNVGYATSVDGTNWVHKVDGPILEPHHAGVSELYFVSFIHHKGDDYIYFEGGSYTEANGYLITRMGSS